MKKFFDNDWNKFEETYVVDAYSLRCGWCDTVVSPNQGYEVKNTGNTVGYIYVCPHCNEVILYNRFSQDTFPQSKYGDSFHKLPKDVNAIYEECRDCFSVGAYTSVLLLARKLLMHIAVDCGAKADKKFVEYVNYLDDNHYIPPNSKKLLEFIREQGNEPNHQIVIKNKEDAEKILKFLSIILAFVYEFADEQGGENGQN